MITFAEAYKAKKIYQSLYATRDQRQAALLVLEAYKKQEE